MKKSTLLSLATAGAIVATSVGTFAAWDQMDATANGTVTLRNPVTVTTSTMGAATEEANYGSTPIYTSKATFKVENAPDTGYEFKPTVTIKNGNDVIGSDKITVTAVDNNTANLEGQHEITVTMTPAETADAKALANTPLTVEVKGEIVQTSTVE